MVSMQLRGGGWSAGASRAGWLACSSPASVEGSAGASRAGWLACSSPASVGTLHPEPPNPTPYTQNIKPYTLYPTPKPCTLHPTLRASASPVAPYPALPTCACIEEVGGPCRGVSVGAPASRQGLGEAHLDLLVQPQGPGALKLLTLALHLTTCHEAELRLLGDAAHHLVAAACEGTAGQQRVRAQ